MCGVVGGVGERNVVSVILEGLSRLEYRGYDSVGVAIIDDDGNLTRQRVTGRVRQLTELCQQTKFKAHIGIGHTRWATHGGVTETNAHPHFSKDTLAIVHNGIIENYAELRSELIEKGYVFDSETDTEVIVHLVHSIYAETKDLLVSLKQAISRLHGAYAIGLINRENPQEILCARAGSPMVIGLGIEENYFASDVSALLPVTQKFVYLEEGDIARITIDGYQIWDNMGNLVTRQVSISELSAAATELGHYRHYMQKEIFEQSRAIADTMQQLGNGFDPAIFGAEAENIFKSINKVQIIACGTSYNAGSIAKYWIEEFANLECAVDIASEYRYRKIPANKDTLVISISQSGETADTMASIKYAIELGMVNTLAICNVPESSLIRLSKLKVLTQAGPEIGVASTKAFTTQLVVLLYLAFTLAKVRGQLHDESEVIEQVRRLPHLVVEALSVEDEIKQIAKEFEYKHNALFLGRHTMAPVAMEGALKLKEISYIHAESYAAGELKHGPLALIDKDMPVIVAMPHNLLADKVKSNVQEVLARQGQVYLFTDKEDELSNQCYRTIVIPVKGIPPYLAPIIYTIPMQLLAYHTAIAKGTDVDKPRNLAKSVTVE
ncbi:MAG: glutamine--fructose-6-phosphate transaminase (isomerizing) [Neisseriales bacterium]|nr:MAG: glutamine--fructose-6-phosphate transaminase (isomerizing) [Neisseriales bacterium]